MVQSPFARLIMGTVFALMLASVTTVAHGKTWSVESWGADTTDCGPRSRPCATFQHVLDLARKNDRIVFGPGNYQAGVIIYQNANGPLSGIKLYSVAGRFATTLFATGGGAVISAPQTNVRIGAKGKGFTLHPFGSSDTGISSYGNNAVQMRIEGNHFFGGDYGVLVQADRVQIRGNLFRGIETYGIFCSLCDKGQIRDNHFDNATAGADADIRVSHLSDVTIAGNRFLDGGGPGIVSHLSAQRVLIRDNAFFELTGAGVEMNNADGARIEGNILNRGSDTALAVLQDTYQRAPMVRNNLTLNNSQSGVAASFLQDAKITGNTSINDTRGIFLGIGITLQDLSRNNVIDAPCGVDNGSFGEITVPRLFTSGVTNLYCNSEPDSSTILVSPADRPSPLRVNRAAKL